MHIHPDVLGKDCPNDYRKNNEKALQDINLYAESIEKGLVFEDKPLEIYINITVTQTQNEDLVNIKQKSQYKKVSFHLDGIKSNSVATQSAKLSFQMK